MNDSDRTPTMGHGAEGSATQGKDRSTWGRSRFGGSGRGLIAVSLTSGVVLSAGFGWLFTILEPANLRPGLLFAVGVVVTFPFSAMLAWALLVDRSTLTGAVTRPEETVESVWYERAAAGAFTDLVAVIGIGAAAMTFFFPDVSGGAVLIGLFGVTAADFGIRYLVPSRRGG